MTEEDIRAAALQYVRKISGFRTPAAHNAAAFDAAWTPWPPPPRRCSTSSWCGQQPAARG
ncbi:DUF2277 family protein [Micromonospora sp. BRA006-A]|nr:DUF2277 family protein [Micromonospora sp. BRA006-A]